MGTNLKYLNAPPPTSEELLKAKTEYMKEAIRCLKAINYIMDVNHMNMFVYIKLIAPILFNLLLLVAIILHLINAISEMNLMDVLEDVINIVLFLAGYWLVITSFKQKAFHRLIDGMSDMSESGIPPRYFETCNFHNNLLRFALVYLTGLIMFYCLMRWFEASTCREYNAANNIDEMCELFFPSRFPFKYNFTPVKQIIYVYEVLAVANLLGPCVVSSICQICIIHHTVIRLQHLLLMVKELKSIDIKEEELLKKYLVHCIKYHETVKRNVNFINVFSKPSNLMIMILGGLSIALCCLSLLLFKNLRVIFPLCGWAITLGITSIVSQDMMNKEELIYMEICNFEWYNFNKECKYLILMFIGKLQQPMAISVGPFTVLGNEFLLERIRETFSLTTMIHSFVEIEN